VGIFTFNIHESIKEDFIEDLKVQTLSLAKLFTIILIVANCLLLGLDIILGWGMPLWFFRILPVVSSAAYLGYNKFLKEKFPRAFSFVYGFVVLSCMLSASGVCFKIFTHAGVQNIDKLGAVVGTSMAILVCYLFAGIAIVSYLWIVGVPLLASIAVIFFSAHLNVVDWLALTGPLLVFVTMGLLCGEQFFLKTKYFAVQRRSQNQAGMLEELKLSYKGLNDENIFLIEQLKSNATFDLLTSAFNRGAGFELLEKEFYYAQRNSEPMTLAYIKVDNVEWVTREYGKEFGDKVIVAVAQVLKETIRKSDLLIRVEDDEFIVVFRQCETRFAKRVIERAQSRAAGMSSQSSFEISFCAGFADSSNDEFSSSKQMIEVADEQMKNEKVRPETDILSAVVNDSEAQGSEVGALANSAAPVPDNSILDEPQRVNTEANSSVNQPPPLFVEQPEAQDSAKTEVQEEKKTANG
jgi:diguanylate cyclase (GGDEF)-like protein